MRTIDRLKTGTKHGSKMVARSHGEEGKFFPLSVITAHPYIGSRILRTDVDPARGPDVGNFC